MDPSPIASARPTGVVATVAAAAASLLVACASTPQLDAQWSRSVARPEASCAARACSSPATPSRS